MKTKHLKRTRHSAWSQDFPTIRGETPTATDYSISKKDFKAFVQDERAIGMNIVPEIDVPAHATSITKVWPELMVKNKVSSLNKNRPLVDHLMFPNRKQKKRSKRFLMTTQRERIRHLTAKLQYISERMDLWQITKHTVSL